MVIVLKPFTYPWKYMTAPTVNVNELKAVTKGIILGSTR
jgi:hypothetical protein